MKNGCLVITLSVVVLCSILIVIPMLIIYLYSGETGLDDHEHTRGGVKIQSG